MCSDANDAALVEIQQRLFRDVRNLARDLLLTALRVANVELQLLDVDRRIDIIFYQALGEHDGVFEVVSIPGHERNGHIRSERELSLLGACPICQHVPLFNALAELDEWALVDRRVLVRAPVFLEAIPIVLR